MSKIKLKETTWSDDSTIKNRKNLCGDIYKNGEIVDNGVLAFYELKDHKWKWHVIYLSNVGMNNKGISDTEFEAREKIYDYLIQI